MKDTWDAIYAVRRGELVKLEVPIHPFYAGATAPVAWMNALDLHKTELFVEPGFTGRVVLTRHRYPFSGVTRLHVHIRRGEVVEMTTEEIIPGEAKNVPEAAANVCSQVVAAMCDDLPYRWQPVTWSTGPIIA